MAPRNKTPSLCQRHAVSAADFIIQLCTPTAIAQDAAAVATPAARTLASQPGASACSNHACSLRKHDTDTFGHR